MFINTTSNRKHIFSYNPWFIYTLFMLYQHLKFWLFLFLRWKFFFIVLFIIIILISFVNFVDSKRPKKLKSIKTQHLFGILNFNQLFSMQGMCFVCLCLHRRVWNSNLASLTSLNVSPSLILCSWWVLWKLFYFMH